MNPENPFVWYPRYFWNQTTLSFDKTLFSIVHRLNNVLSGCLGLVALLLVVYMVRFRTPNYFKEYSEMLMISALADLFFIVVNLFCQIRLHISNVVVLATFNGSASRLPILIQCLILPPQAAGPMLICVLLPIIYFYRFWIIRFKTKPSVTLILRQVFVVFVIMTVMAILIVPAGCGFLIDSNVKDYSQLWYIEDQIPFLFVADSRHIFSILFLLYLVLIVSCSYALAIWLAKQTVGDLASRATEISERHHRVQHQFALILTFQSLIPHLTTVIPVILIISFSFANISIGFFADIVMCTLSWAPFVSSSTTLIICKPYKAEMFRWFCCWPEKRVYASTETAERSTTRIPPPNVHVEPVNC